MNRSGHKPDQPLSKKDPNPKPIDLTRSTRRPNQQPPTTKPQPPAKLSTSRSKHLKHQKKPSTTRIKQPSRQSQQKHADYFKSPTTTATNIYPSRESSSIIRANLSNDYCVNEYFTKSNTKGKTCVEKLQPKSFYQPHQQDRQQEGEYFSGGNNEGRAQTYSEIEPYSQEYGLQYDCGREKERSDDADDNNHKVSNKISSMMKKISFSDKRAFINTQGKIVASSKQPTKKAQLNKSTSHHTLSFSKQYLSKNDDRKKSKSRSKIKSRSKQAKIKEGIREKDGVKDEVREKKIKIEDNRLVKMKSCDNAMKRKQGGVVYSKPIQTNNQQPSTSKTNQKPTTLNCNSSSANIHFKPSSTSKPLQTTTTATIKPLPKQQATQKKAQKQPQVDQQRWQQQQSQKRFNTQSSETITSTRSQHPTQPFYYYHPTTSSTTTLNIDPCSSSCSSSPCSSTSQPKTRPQSPPFIDLAEIAAEIASEINLPFNTHKKEKDFRVKGVHNVERLKCVNLIASVCGELKAKRETFFLAVGYFDRYVMNCECMNMKVVALTCIMLALKIDFPQLLPKYCSSFRPNPQATIKKTSKSHKKKKSQLSSSTSSILKQKDSFLDTKDKLTSLITLPIYTTAQDLYSQEKQEDFHIGEIIEMEVEIITRLRFKFYYKTLGYWVDLLTTVWDQYVGDMQKQRGKGDTEGLEVYFKRTAESTILKHHKEFKLFSHLNQALQSTLTTPNSLTYSPITLTLSLMYLLIRLHLQQRKSLQPLTIYKHYRDNLSKSCNLIFCDTLGVNAVFGDFLAKLGLNMAVIVDAVQFVCRFVVPEEFKIWNYEKEVFGESYCDRLGGYLYNPNLWRVNKG